MAAGNKNHRQMLATTVGLIVLANLFLTVVFYVGRVPYMNEDNYTTNPYRPLRPSLDSFYVSIMTQTTIGVPDIIPKSSWAITVACAQAVTTFAVYLYLGLVFLMSTT